MALTSTMYSISLELSDIDRGVYESLDLKMAMHPSESAEYFATRLLAYALEYTEGLEFSSGGISDTEDPPIVGRDLTGRIVTWIEIGMPDADRLHRAAKAAERVALYTHRELRTVLAQLEGKKIHRAAEIPIVVFERRFIDELAARLERRMKISLSVTEGHLYLDAGGEQLSTVIDPRTAAG